MGKFASGLASTAICHLRSATYRLPSESAHKEPRSWGLGRFRELIAGNWPDLCVLYKGY